MLCKIHVIHVKYKYYTLEARYWVLLDDLHYHRVAESDDKQSISEVYHCAGWRQLILVIPNCNFALIP